MSKGALSHEGMGSEAQRGTGQAGPTCQLKNGEPKAVLGFREELGLWGERSRDLTVPWGDREKNRETERDRDRERQRDMEMEIGRDREMETDTERPERDRETTHDFLGPLTLCRGSHNRFHENPSFINWSPNGQFTKLS